MPTPILFHNPDSSIKFPGQMSYALTNNDQSLDFNNAFTRLHGIAISSEIGFSGTAEVGWSLGLFANRSMYTSNDPLSFINSMQVSLSKVIENSYLHDAKFIKTIDFFPSSVDSRTLKKVLDAAVNLETLILPFSPSYQISEIEFPRGLRKLVIYNQLIDVELISKIAS